jgi:TRAP-type mannitol/chloroaromatic compound transport system substrate-binding protein
MKDGKLKPTKNKLMKKCSDWNEKYMSSAAKEPLIKYVAQSISTYAMSIFKFSARLCDDLEKIIRDFWWGDRWYGRK